MKKVLITILFIVGAIASILGLILFIFALIIPHVVPQPDNPQDTFKVIAYRIYDAVTFKVSMFWVVFPVCALFLAMLFWPKKAPGVKTKDLELNKEAYEFLSMVANEPAQQLSIGYLQSHYTHIHTNDVAGFGIFENRLRQRDFIIVDAWTRVWRILPKGLKAIDQYRRDNPQ